MLPLFLLLLLGWHYFQISAGKTSTNQDLVSDEHSTWFQCSVTRVPFRLQNSDIDPNLAGGMESSRRTSDILQLCNGLN